MHKETGIIMSGDHPLKVLDGLKTMTRRVIKPQPMCHCDKPDWHGKKIDWIGWKYEGREGWFCYSCGSGLRAYDEWSSHGIICPYGQVGDRLWAVADLVSRLKESIADNSTEQMMSGLKKLPALILDDWGQNRGSAWELQKLEEIVVARERAGLITIITTNLSLAMLEEQVERIVSRGRDVAEAVILFNSAGNYRPLKKARKG